MLGRSCLDFFEARNFATSLDKALCRSLILRMEQAAGVQ